MKKTLITLAVLLTSAQACFAALSPINQSIVEYRTLLNGPELSQYFNQNEYIVDIKRVERGFVIITNRSELFAEVIYLQGKRPGPHEFKIHYYPPRPAERSHDRDNYYNQREVYGQFDQQPNSQFGQSQRQPDSNFYIESNSRSNFNRNDLNNNDELDHLNNPSNRQNDSSNTIDRQRDSNSPSGSDSNTLNGAGGTSGSTSNR